MIIGRPGAGFKAGEDKSKMMRGNAAKTSTAAAGRISRRADSGCGIGMT
ncbi:hypothetical protein [Amorphus sp. 3PC139-8]